VAFLSEASLAALGFKRLGVHVKISDKASIYNPELMEVGDHSRIDDFCVVSGKVTIGRNVHVAVFCNIGGGEPGVTLEDFSGLAYGCHVFTQSDDYSGRTLTNPTVPDKYKRETKAPVLIKRHSIVGTASVILPGVTLEEGTSIGALSLVHKSTRPWTLYFGIPAKRLKDRHRELLELEQEYLREEAMPRRND
jgi:acetyltransferase-like isoleucine patch superfamily enzyme